jgi:ribose transport system ATP-binding protein
MSAFLTLRNASKRFPGVVALADATFDVRAGEVHALVGENGAGKSTLIKLMSGVYTPDDGEVLVDGVPMPASPAAAHRAGIATIHQDHQLIPYMSIAENIMLGRWFTDRGLVAARRTNLAAQRAAERVIPDIDLSRPARTVTPGEGQLIEVARALSEESLRVLIMDEPTASLSPADVERLFAIIDDFRSRGIGILFVAHSLEEVFAIADRITVIRDGRVITTRPAGELSIDEVVRLMVGEDVEISRPPRPLPGRPVLSVRHLTRAGEFDDVSFDVRAGEVVTIGGLVGAGRTELARSIFGIDGYDSGEILVDGVRLRPGANRAIEAGIGFVPEDRRRQGIVPLMSVRENVTLGVLDKVFAGGLLRGRHERRVAEEQMTALQVRAASADVPAGTLSGGNQQKLIIGRWLARDPRVLILDEPTKGIDIGAKAEIHRLIWRLSDAGVAVLVVTSDLDELLLLADRTLVMRAGRFVGELADDDIRRDAVMAYAAGTDRAAVREIGFTERPNEVRAEA